MQGEPIEAVNNGVQMMISSLRQNPQAIETAFISVITFGSTAQQIIPLTDLASFQPVTLQASGQTPLGAALRLTAEKMQTEVTRTTAEKKGDWKPIVFILTDGKPSDDWEAGLAEFEKQKAGLVVACGAGPDVNTTILQRITDNVISLDSADSQSISKFFAWVSASIGVSSTRVEENGKEASGIKDLPPPPKELNVVV